MKKVSVIIPVYNVAGYLERCVDSVLRQTYENLEIILIDDGSTDGSGHLCDIFKHKDPERIKVIHQKNGGLSAARNTGISNSTGEYIAFLDSDDYIHPQKYEVLVHNMEIHEADIVECDYYKFGYHEDTKEFWGCSMIIADKTEALTKLMNWEMFDISVWSKLYKRELIEGIDFEVGKIHEDEFWTYKVLSRANKLIHLNYVFYYYQQSRSDSILTKGFTEKNYASTEALLERVDYIKENIPELTELAQSSVVTHVFHHMMNFCLNDKRGKEVWMPYYMYYVNLLTKLPEEWIDSYCKGSSRKKAKVKIWRNIGKVSVNLCGYLYRKTQKFFAKHR